VYKLIIDGLSKDALKKLADVVNVPVKAGKASLRELLSSHAVRRAVLLP
jgi:hypothetical protein